MSTRVSMDTTEENTQAFRQTKKNRVRGGALADISNRIPQNQNKQNVKKRRARPRNAVQDENKRLSRRNSTSGAVQARRTATSRNRMISQNSRGRFTSSSKTHTQDYKQSQPADMEIISMSDDEEDTVAFLASIDRAEMKDALTFSEYANDIYTYMRSTEAQYQSHPDYIRDQKELNPRMREILIDWLVEVHLKFKLEPETLYLTINVIDRFLSKKVVKRGHLQLVGCAAMLVASKYEEIYAPEVQDFVYMSDHAYTKEQILLMETRILNVLGFNLTVHSSLKFSRRLLKVAGKQNDQQLAWMVDYLMELTLQHVAFLNFLPSMIASAAVFVALYLQAESSNQAHAWTRGLQRYTKYTEESMRPCVMAMWKLLTRSNSKYVAVKTKYRSSKFGGMSLLKFNSDEAPCHR